MPNRNIWVLGWMLSVLVGLLVGCCTTSNTAANLGAAAVTRAVLTPPLSVLTSSCSGPAVAINGKLVVQFSNAIDATTLTPATFMVTGPGPTTISGALSLDATGKLVTFTPTAPFAPLTTFMLVITVGLKDLAGVSLPSSFICSFTTSGVADVDAPAIVSNFPVCGTVNVALDQLISVTFDGNGGARDNQPLDPLTVNSTTFIVSVGGVPVAGTVTYDAVTNVATFTPAANLAPNTVFTITVTTGVLDVAGNPLPAPLVCNFTTGATPQGIRRVDTPCDVFTVLAGATVTNTGPTRISGNLGLSPGTSVTGFPPGLLLAGGSIHVNDQLANAAKIRLTAAFNDAASRPNAIPIVPQDLGGRTLPPGVYNAAAAVQILNGNLTLDGQGDPNAVFIFQIGSSLTTNSGSRVILLNGAQHANVFWQIGSSATLGTNSVFQGTLLANQSITLTTGAVLNGCALARIGAVTLDSNTLTGN